MSSPIGRLGARDHHPRPLPRVLLWRRHRYPSLVRTVRRLTLDGNNVVGFAEKSAQNDKSGAGLINGGIYALRREAVDQLRTPSSIETDLLPALVSDGELSGVVDEGFFIDIGLPETYAQAQTSVPEWWREKLATRGRP